jgi:hypothetical protein
MRKELELVNQKIFHHSADDHAIDTESMNIGIEVILCDPKTKIGDVKPIK